MRKYLPYVLIFITIAIFVGVQYTPSANNAAAVVEKVVVGVLAGLGVAGGLYYYGYHSEMADVDDDDKGWLATKLRESEEYEDYMDEMRQDKPPRDNS